MRYDTIGYMCTVDFEFELGSTSVKVYEDVESLKETHTCWEGCGITEVRVSYVRRICEGSET